MMNIHIEDYWMDREDAFADEITDAIKENAIDLLRRINLLLPFMHNVDFEINPRTGTLVSSGWRPKSVNNATPGAAPKSKHVTGQAIDLYDPDGEIKTWCYENQDILARPEIDLYIEHPSATKGWLHAQSVPPKSQASLPIHQRRRWFYP